MRRASIFVAAALGTVLGACEEPGVPLRLAPYQFRLEGTDSVFHWPTSSVPVRLYAEPAGRLPQYVERGARAWQRQFLYGEFSSTVVDDSTAADVIVVMEGDPPPDVPPSNDPPRLVCEGLTVLPPRGADANGVVRFTAPLRVTVRWFSGSDPAEAQNCLAMVTMHELGHALGILSHSDDPVDLMYSMPQVTWPSLRDQATVQTLYHVPADILPWLPGADTPVAPGPGAVIP